MIRHSLDDNTYQSFLSSRYCFTTQVRSFCVRYYRIRCYSRRISKNGDQMRLMCDTCICLDICLQIHSQAFLKSFWMNSICCRGMQTKPLQSLDNIVENMNLKKPSLWILFWNWNNGKFKDISKLIKFIWSILLQLLKFIFELNININAC